METESSNTASVIDPTPADDIPATGADAQNPEIPATGAEEQKPEQDSPEKQQERELSRRARARDRELKARVRAETERDMARAELERLKSSAKPESGEPKRESYEDYESYLRAVTKYDAEQVADSKLKADREERQRQQPNVRAQAWAESEKEVIKESKDYQETVTAFLEDSDWMSQPAREAIVDAGPKLLYHLAKNPDVAEKLAELPPRRQVAELVKLEESLAKPAAKRQSGAPNPPTPVSGGKGSHFNPETAPQAEFEAALKAGQLGRVPHFVR